MGPADSSGWLVVGAPEPRTRSSSSHAAVRCWASGIKYTYKVLRVIALFFFSVEMKMGSAGSMQTSQGRSHLSHLLDNAYSNAKFRPAFKTFGSVSLKYNRSHICNLKLASSYLKKKN